MDEKVRQRITDIKKKIQQKEFQQALDDCDYIFIMISNKIAMVHLFAGFCHERLKNDAKAEREYKQAEELEPQNVECFKALYGLYNRTKNPETANYLKKLCSIYQKTDRAKFREHYIKLVRYYEAIDELETIVGMIQEMRQTETEVTPELVALGEAYYKLSTEAKCFDVAIIGSLGTERSTIAAESKEALDYLLLKCVKYLKQVRYDYKISAEQLCDTIVYLKSCFPESAAILLLLLTDDYAVTHVELVETLMTEIYLFLSAYFNEELTGKNYYSGTQFIHPEVFLASMILSYEYLAFFCEFFSLAEPMKPLFLRLSKEQDKLRKELNNEELQRYISEFVLTEALSLSRMLDSEAAYKKLGVFREKAKSYGGFVEEVVARLAMKVFKDYKELTDMKNVLKVRIAKEPGNNFLLKYYYDYLIRISKSYKVFDEEIDIEEILDRIVAMDADDYRYRSERVWLRFSQAVYRKEEDPQVFQELCQEMQQLSQKPGISQQDLAAIRKKLLIMNVHIGKAANLRQELLEILSLDPKNYHTYLCLGVDRYVAGSLQQALDFFRRGFLLYQRDYHLNRYLYACLIGLNQHKEAAEFASKIYMGFKNVFWLNYALAMHNINSRQFENAEAYLTKAIEAFTAGRTRNYDLSFEKLHERSDYSSPYLIRQNKYRILDQYLIVPEAVLFQRVPLVSNYYYKDELSKAVPLVEVRMWIQMAEILKVLGRLATALKCLSDAKQLAEKAGFLWQTAKWTVTLQNEQMFLQVVLLFKELAAVCYYCGSSKEAQDMLQRSLTVNEKLMLFSNRYSTLSAELLALKFEIGIERLTLTIRFQSYETTSNFIRNFKVPECAAPTVPYLKSLYQYQVLCYLHNYQDPQSSLSAIATFLKRFGLDYLKIESSDFSNQYFSLRQDDRKQVKQAVEDLMVFLYLVELYHGAVQLRLSKEYILNVLEVFPDSTVLYILYGILEADPSRKTGAFLKCIEMDKNNAISVDYLAYLFLKNRNLMAAAKLYLKSVELNPLALKSYIGLTITLFSIFLRCQADSKQEYAPIIESAMAKVKVYLEYLRVSNPTIEYSLIDFFQLLLTSKDSESEFDRALRLDSGLRAYSYMKRAGKSIENRFTERVLNDIPLGQLWKETNSGLIAKLAESFKLDSITSDKELSVLATHLTGQVREQLNDLVNQLDAPNARLLSRQLQHLYNEAVTALLLTNKVHNSDIDPVLDLFAELQKLELKLRIFSTSQQNLRAIKMRLLNYSLTCEANIKDRIEALFSSVETPEFHLKEAMKNGEAAFKRCIAVEMMKDPTNEIARKHLNTVLTIRYRKYMQGRMKEVARGRLLNEALESSEKRVQTLTKLVMLYNEPSGWLMLIYEKYQSLSNRTRTNLRYWLKLLRMNTIFKTASHRLKPICDSLLVEMYVWLEEHYDKDADMLNTIQADASLKTIYDRFRLQNRATSNLDRDAIKQLSGTMVPLNVLSVMVGRFVPTKQLHEALTELCKLPLPKREAQYLSVVRFLAAMKAQNAVSDLDEYQRSVLLQAAIPQVSDLLTNLLIRMTVALFLKNYSELDQLLLQASRAYLSNQHEVLLTCYFDIMLNYEKLLQAPTDPDSFESVRSYIDKTLELCHSQPGLASFLHYLNGLVLLKFGEMYGLGKQQASRSIFKAIWLNPSIGKQIITKIQKTV